MGECSTFQPRKDKETEMNGEIKLEFLNRIIHEEVLCRSVLKINHGVGVVIIIIHLIRTEDLITVWYTLRDRSHPSAVRRLSLDKVINREPKCKSFVKSKIMTLSSASERYADLAFPVDTTVLRISTSDSDADFKVLVQAQNRLKNSSNNKAS